MTKSLHTVENYCNTCSLVENARCVLSTVEHAASFVKYCVSKSGRLYLAPELQKNATTAPPGGVHD